jgi:hypothetical protein
LVHHFRPKDTLTLPTPLVNGTQDGHQSQNHKLIRLAPETITHPTNNLTKSPI